MNVEINIVEQKPEPPTADLDDIMRAADMTLMSLGQRLEDRARDGAVTMEDVVDVLRQMFGEAVQALQEGDENGCKEN